MPEAKFDISPDPRQSQLICDFDGPRGIYPGAPAGGGGMGRFTSRKPLGNGSVIALHSRTGPLDAKDAEWVTQLNRGFALSDQTPGEAYLEGLLDKYGGPPWNVKKACDRARDRYIAGMIFEETGRGLAELLEGLIPALLLMLATLVITTAVGGGIGAGLGALAGGVGAAPGAAIGAELGFDFGVWLLTWIGIGFLIEYIARHFGEVLRLFSSGFKTAWNAGSGPQSKDEDIDHAARDIARAVAVLIRLILEGIVMYLLAKGTAALASRAAELVGELRKSRLGRGFAEWVQKNYESLIRDKKVNPELRRKPTEGASGSGQTSGEAQQTVPQQQPQEPRTPPRLPPPERPTPAQEVTALPGHGNARHGYQTTTAEQIRRVQTGMAPDGVSAPTSRATRFDSPEAELDAVQRAQARTAQRVATGQQSTALTVDSQGHVKLPRDTSVVTGHPGGYGSGVEVMRDAATGRPLPGRPTQPTGQDPNALVVLEYNPSTKQWDPVTQYPTDKPVTP